MNRFAAIIFLALVGVVTALAKEPAVKLDEEPQILKRVDPVYPYSMSRAGLTGQVTIEFIINTMGHVQDARVIQSNNPGFERAALDAVSQWTFTPGKKGGHPVNVRAAMPIIFNLDESDSGAFWRITKGKNHSSLPPEMQWETAPFPMFTTFPVYPWEALQAKIKGTTKLSFVIGYNGRVIKADVMQATTPEMGQAVKAMIDTWMFSPARKADGTPALAAVSIEHRFDPLGRGDVPVGETAHYILGLLEKHPEKIIPGSQLDQRPKLVASRVPEYPLALQAAAQAGSALIEFFIDGNGDAQLPRIVSSTAPEFGYAAVQAVATWRFSPPTKNGKAVVTRVQVPIEFKFQSSSEAKPHP